MLLGQTLIDCVTLTAGRDGLGHACCRMGLLPKGLDTCASRRSRRGTIQFRLQCQQERSCRCSLGNFMGCIGLNPQLSRPWLEWGPNSSTRSAPNIFDICLSIINAGFCHHTSIAFRPDAERRSITLPVNVWLVCRWHVLRSFFTPIPSLCSLELHIHNSGRWYPYLCHLPIGI